MAGQAGGVGEGGAPAPPLFSHRRTPAPERRRSGAGVGGTARRRDCRAGRAVAPAGRRPNMDGSSSLAAAAAGCFFGKENPSGFGYGFKPKPDPFIPGPDPIRYISDLTPVKLLFTFRPLKNYK